MKEAKNILLTFDYELFQGVRSGSVARCMLEPTNLVLDILKSRNAAAIFFIDMMYLVRLKEASTRHSSAKNDFEKIERQIIRMAEDGHYVFNHLHPHWLDAVYSEETNDWKLTDTSRYAFASLTDTDRKNVFDTTMDLLNNILGKATKHPPADGFRAGGLYIQPFSAFKPYFEKHGIKYDFSVLAGATGSMQNKSASFDFSAIKKSVYSFLNDVSIEDKNGAFREYALSVANIPFSFRLFNSLFYRLNSNKPHHQRYGDGVSTQNKIYFPPMGALTASETFGVEMLNTIKLPIYLSELRRTNFLHLLSHPKLVSNYNLQVFNRLLDKVVASGFAEFDFKKFSLPA